MLESTAQISVAELSGVVWWVGEIAGDQRGSHFGVAWRAAQGPFKDMTDLRRVKGIGPKKFEAIRHFLRPIAQAAAGSERAVAKQLQ
jgi:hypothetical protein